MSIFIKSTTPGMTWAITDTKRRGIVGASALEGKYAEEPGYGSSFEFIPFQDRAMDYTGTATRATAKTKAEAIEAIKAKLQAAGWID